MERLETLYSFLGAHALRGELAVALVPLFRGPGERTHNTQHMKKRRTRKETQEEEEENTSVRQTSILKSLVK